MTFNVKNEKDFINMKNYILEKKDIINQHTHIINCYTYCFFNLEKNIEESVFYSELSNIFYKELNSNLKKNILFGLINKFKIKSTQYNILKEILNDNKHSAKLDKHNFYLSFLIFTSQDFDLYRLFIRNNINEYKQSFFNLLVSYSHRLNIYHDHKEKYETILSKQFTCLKSFYNNEEEFSAMLEQNLLKCKKRNKQINETLFVFIEQHILNNKLNKSLKSKKIIKI